MKTWRIPAPEPRQRLTMLADHGSPDLYRLDFDEWFYIVIDAAGPHIVRPATAEGVMVDRRARGWAQAVSEEI